MTKTTPKFIDFLPNCKYRYLDLTGLGRPPISSNVIKPDLNKLGYDSYMTVNGFDTDSPTATREDCTNINSFFVDVDNRKDLAELEEIKALLMPTFIIETMRGWHLYWCLDEILYKNEMSEKEWEETISRWEKIEQAIVDKLKGDDKAKDLCRILRVPDTFYWKKSGSVYQKGTEGIFKIKGIHKSMASTYSMRRIEDVFPIIEAKPVSEQNTQAFAEAERVDFFKKVDLAFPIEERDSFLALSSGKGKVTTGERNIALLITASLMRDAGWSKKKALEHFTTIGWYGIETEKGGLQEIHSTVASAYQGGYHYSYKNEIIARNMTPEEQIQIQDAFAGVFKERKEKDRHRFSTYEKEILTRYPYLRKNEIGLVFDYENGVYKLMTDLEVEGIIYRALEEDLLWLFRTGKFVADKFQCLLSIIPDLKLSDDKGETLNVRNGLLNIITKELRPHTPDFVSLVQFPVMYDQNALCPVWEKCMEDWMGGKEMEEKKLLLQQFGGYILSSEMLYDRALFLVGDGANGKSTFVDTLAMIVGKDGVSHIDLEGLYTQFGMKGLIGKRLNVIEEVHGNYYQSNKLKKLISGEPVTIDIKHKDQFAFRPQAKFVFAVNIMPRVDDTSTATERRICAVVFSNNFRANPKIDLRGKNGLLAQELSGILNWMLEGARKLREAKMFVVTQEQVQLLAEYRQENSSVEAFIADCLEFAEGQSLETNDIYDEYKKYCQSDGRKFKAKISFTKELKAYGHRHSKFTFHERESGKGSSGFEGVRINHGWSKESMANHEYKTQW